MDQERHPDSRPSDDSIDEAVIAADDTGMLGSARALVETEIAEELEEGDEERL